MHMNLIMLVVVFIGRIVVIMLLLRIVLQRGLAAGSSLSLRLMTWDMQSRDTVRLFIVEVIKDGSPSRRLSLVQHVSTLIVMVICPVMVIILAKLRSLIVGCTALEVLD